MVKMKPKPMNQSGFVPLLILILLLVAVGVYLVYTRVLHAQSGI
jgi:hypothetical protein